jgi:creatinine amidohydrolase
MHPYREEDYRDILWENFTWEEIKDCAKKEYIVVLPLGSIEQHGPMLPVGCDLFLSRSWANEGARQSKEKYNVHALVLPPLPYGIATGHMDFAGTICVSLQVYISLLQEIVNEIVRNGFKKIVCMSGHGGNIAPAKDALKDMLAKFKEKNISGVKLYMADETNCFFDAHKVYTKVNQGQFSFHADACETSYYLYHRPDMVRKECAVKPELKVKGKPIAEYLVKEITESGATGDPSKASPEYGEEQYIYFSGALANFLKKVSEDV